MCFVAVVGVGVCPENLLLPLLHPPNPELMPIFESPLLSDARWRVGEVGFSGCELGCPEEGGLVSCIFLVGSRHSSLVLNNGSKLVPEDVVCEVP